MYFWLRLVAVSLSLAAPAIHAQAPAAPPPAAPAPIIGVVDVDEIMQDALAAKAVRNQAAKYRQDFQTQGSAEEAALRSTQQAIEQERKTLSPQDLAEKARAFDASVADYQKRELARRRAFEKSFNAAMTKVQQAMFEATRQAAMAHGANVILPRGQVLLFDDKMNMTKEIIALMDKALPTAEFPPPVVEDAPQPTPPPATVKKKN